MEVRAFAEAVFFGDTLQDKLLAPGRTRDDAPGTPVQHAEVPGRPAGLELRRASGARVKFPTLSEMEDDRRRGHVLHFFANHELLALELMALALLRFPDAPASWRKTLVATMRDEQRHLELYVGRMRALGVEPGSIPVNRFFWDHISTMAHPMDFVVRMSLTFEQANLDFSLFYRDAFQGIGDTVSASIMDEVLEDEVAHVRHGVRAFEAWRDPGRSFWEAYREGLPFPLTPARAKGKGFTAVYRKKAGLPDDFIDNLRVYSHSKGRPPTVHLFNPATEAALACRSQHYTPRGSIRGLIRDLEMAPMCLAVSEDVVLVRELPATAHLRRLADVGIAIPEFIAAPLDTGIPSDHELASRRFSGLAPWGWDPTVASHLAPLAPHTDLQAIVERRRLFASKAWLAPQIPGLIGLLSPQVRAHCVTTYLPTVATTLGEVRQQVAEHFGAGTGGVVVKAPFGTAGRDALRLRNRALGEHEVGWVQKVLDVQEAVVIEPWYERVMDVSIQFNFRDDGTVARLGVTQFFTDASGRYRGSLVGPLAPSMQPKLQHFFFQAGGRRHWVTASLEQVVEGLAQRLAKDAFHGPAGIDAMVICQPNGDYALRLPLELNPRATMGHVALGAARPWGSRVVTLLMIVMGRELEAAGCETFGQLVLQLSRQLPDDRMKDGALRQGVFSINDPNRASHALALVLVGGSLDVLTAALRAVGVADPTRRVDSSADRPREPVVPEPEAR